jgi:hypothetical protein
VKPKKSRASAGLPLARAETLARVSKEKGWLAGILFELKLISGSPRLPCCNQWQFAVVCGSMSAPCPPSSVRSRVANGSKLLPLTDGRSAAARRFRDLFEDICVDLGGAAHLSEGQRQLVRRAAMLSAESERLEALAAPGEPGFDIDLYGLARIGLKRVPRDATTLQQYVAKSTKAPAAEIDEEAIGSDAD